MDSDYLRYPHIHGNRVTFIAENDVWVAPLEGGRAWRISAMQLAARNPRFSPDGTTIAWTVVQGGAPEVVAADVEGGNFRRLTYWGHQSTRVKGFTASGDVLATSAFRHEDSRLSWAYRVPVDGSEQTVIPLGPVDTIAGDPLSGDGEPVVVGSVLTREPAWWKRYRGGTAGKFWIDADGSGDFRRLLPEVDGNLADPMWVAGRLAFLSDHEGHGNLYSVDPQGGDLRRHTDHDEYYVRHASTDGTGVVFESAGTLWHLPSLGGEAVRLSIALGSASTARRPRPLKVDRHLACAFPTADGTASIIEAHGTLHWLTHRDGPSRVVEAAAGVRARLGRPVGSSRVAYVADTEGEEALYIREVFAPPGRIAASDVSAGDGEAARVGAQAVAADDVLQRVAFDGRFRASALAVSPDGTRIAVASETGALDVVTLASGERRRIVATDQGPIEAVTFSQDSAWLAWAEPMAQEGTRNRVRLAAVAAPEEVIDVTDGRFRDWSPTFTRDGKYLAFLSDRSFDPVYDTHRFDLSFPASTKPYLVALAAGTPSPFGPTAASAGKDAGKDAGHDAGKDAGKNGTAPDAAGEAPRVVVDAELLMARTIALPVGQGTYDVLRAVEGGLLWTAGDIGGVTGDGRASSSEEEPPRRLERFDLARRTVEVLARDVDAYEVSADGSTAVHTSGGKVTAIPTDGKVDADSPRYVDVTLDRIRVMLDPVSVWTQAFEEAWRLQRDFYWTEDMAGIDWAGVRERYLPLVARLGSHDDLADLLWELHGELGTSHAYVAPVLVTEPGGHQGFLGGEFAPADGGWAVTKVFATESSDPKAVSPLSAPGAAVQAGDVIEAIDGVPVPAAFGPGVLLAGAAGVTVELTVRSGAGGGSGGDAVERRRVAVVPLRSEERLRYQTWVAANRAAVQEASGGRFGYLHIPDMVAHGWGQLHRDLDRETARDALVVDVRRNRGGHTSQLVAELIGRRVTAWSMPRGEAPGTYPAHAPRGPVVVLTDEFAGSDGDIITQVAKLRGIGPVVGTRTWGGVVGIDGRFKLADGTGVNQPRYGFHVTDGIGWSIENHGVDPDVEVPFPPHAHAAGEDPQLERGVGILRDLLAEDPAAVPPAREGYPALRPGPLPPRPQDLLGQ